MLPSLPVSSSPAVSAVGAVSAVMAMRGVSADYPSRSDQGSKASLGSGSHRDKVELSGAAIARSLRLNGLSPDEIAARMGLDIETIDGYLGN